MQTVQQYFSLHGIDRARPQIEMLHDPIDYYSLFVSDLHFWGAGALARDFFHFLKHTRTKYLYLVGDIFDFWKMDIHKPHHLGRMMREQNILNQLTAIHKVLGVIDRGTKVVFIPGNHDEVLRDFNGMNLGNMAVMFEAVHETQMGDRYLVMHGDSFDPLIRNYHRLSMLSTQAYESLARLSVKIDRWRTNARFNAALEGLGLTSHWSLAHAIRTTTDEKTYTAPFRDTMALHMFRENKKLCTRGAQPLKGVICGHTHAAEDDQVAAARDGITGKIYGPEQIHVLNAGAWIGPPGYETLSLTDDLAWRAALSRPVATAVAEPLKPGPLHHIQWVPGQGVTTLHLPGHM